MTEYIKSIRFVPGAVAANTNITVPAYAGKIAKLVAAFIHRGVNQSVNEGGTATYTITVKADVLTVVNAAPAAGEIQLVDEQTVQLGDALNAEDVLELVYIPKGAVSGF